MFRCDVRVAGMIFVGALVLSAAAGCGSTDDGKEGRPAVDGTRRPLRTAQPDPTGRPGKQTVNVERGTTAHVGGLRIGVMAAGGGEGAVAVLAGPGVPAEADWTVSGRAGLAKRLANGYLVTIDEVFDAEAGPGRTGSDGGSVTLTVTPPAVTPPAVTPPG
ncbi:hypothetical protein [Actinomadura sp. HBU206391]|uniref:hypothetical protein n=1 Tax=Actinomadura sp. HBU206391 TaxID=2731692 RepID=UPI00165093CF|nr:hypothetical protein [Actinomadura sp. HBU206391]MBC6457774.1 hypothetical protein [Actinomadura sp. HBU206391]